MARFLLVSVLVSVLALAANCSSERGSQEQEPAVREDAHTEASEDTTNLSADGSESGASAGYVTVTDAAEALSIEVPAEWYEVITGEGSEAGHSWSSFGGENTASSITASTDLSAWHSASGAPGAYIATSRNLAQRYTDEELVASGPNDFSTTCEPGARQDFDRLPYSGRVQDWKNCGGDDEANFLTLAAAPEGRECVVLLQIGTHYGEADVESVRQRILNTFEVDCERIIESVSSTRSTSDPAPEAGPAPHLRQEFDVGYEQEVALEDEGLKVRFASVESDSRCPSGARCITEGYAQITVELSKGGQDTTSVKLNTPNSRQETYPSKSSYLDYTIELVALSPSPGAAGSTEDMGYVARLLITRS